MPLAGVARPWRAESIRMAFWASGSEMPVPARRAAPAAPWGAASEVPESVPRQRSLCSAQRWCAYSLIATATRSGFLRPAGVGPREEKLGITSSLGSAVSRMSRPPMQSVS